jgi:hypothetical protein
MRKLLLATVFTALSHTAMADCNEPSHICFLGYSPAIRYEITGQVGQPTVFTFPPDERVYRVLISGKPLDDGNIGNASWNGLKPAAIATDGKSEGPPLGNNLALTPGVDASYSASILTVITIRHNPPTCSIEEENCEQKIYPFTLKAVPLIPSDEEMKSVTFNVIFKGLAAPPRAATVAPNIPIPTIKVTAPKPTPVPPKAKSANEQKEIEERTRTAALNTNTGECHYEAHGPGLISFTPPCPTDDGRQTRIHFPGLTRQPAVYIAKDMLCNAHSEERLARQHSDGDYVIVEEVAPFLCLRLGDDVLALINKKFDPAHAPYDLTGVPGVKLELR